MIVPLQVDDVFLADVRRTMQRRTGVSLWWLGQSGFLVHYDGVCIAIDPYLSDSLTVKYATTAKPHVRMTARVIDPVRLDMVSLVTSSHNHTDHLDAETLLPLVEANPAMQFVIPEANRAFIADRLRCDPALPIGLTDGQQATVGDFILHGIPAAHNDLERDALGRCKFMGFVAEIGPYRVYHSGDTLWYEGMEEILRPFKVDVAFLPINGNKPERRVAGNLNADEAARLGNAIGAELVIPHHYDMFAFNTADPNDFVNACQQYNTPFRVPQLGERISVARTLLSGSR